MIDSLYKQIENMKTTVEVSVHKPYEDIDEDKDKQNSAHRADEPPPSTYNAKKKKPPTYKDNKMNKKKKPG